MTVVQTDFRVDLISRFCKYYCSGYILQGVSVVPVGRVLLLIDAIGASSKCNTISVSVILYFATTTHYVKRNISNISLHMQTTKQNTKQM